MEARAVCGLLGHNEGPGGEALHVVERQRLPADRLRGGHVPSAPERGQAGEQALDVRSEKVEAGLQHGAQAAVADGHVAARGFEPVQAAVQAGQHLCGRQHGQAGRRQLQRQRQPVQMAAQGADGRGVLRRQGEVRPRCLCPVYEQPDARAVPHLCEGGVRVGNGHGRQGQFLLPLDVEPLPRGDQAAQAGAVRQQRPHDQASLLGQMLEVVQQQQGGPSPAPLRDMLHEVAARGRRQADLRSDGVQEETRFRDACQ